MAMAVATANAPVLPLRLEWFLRAAPGAAPPAAASRCPCQCSGASHQELLIAQNALKMARDAEGCHVLQQALEDAGSDEARQVLVAGLRGHVWELTQCPHGNHVIQKYIITMNSAACQFIINELLGRGPGGVARVARDRYGCRILQRMMEHVQMHQLTGIVDALLRDGVALSMNRYGTYVMQHLLEHGTESQQRCLIQDLARNAMQLCVSNDACMVLEAAFTHGPAEGQELLLAAVLKSDGAIAAMAHMRRGHPVALAALRLMGSTELREAQRQIEAQVSSLAANRYGRLVLTSLRQHCAAEPHAECA